VKLKMNISFFEKESGGNTKISFKLLSTVILILVFLIGLSLYLSNSNNAYNSDFENRTSLFQGYGAYLDDRINYSGVRGSSMEPTFGDNDKILWVEVAIENVEQGDIIIYRDPTDSSDPDLIVHRVVDIMNDEGTILFETKGDNRKTSDANTSTSSYYVSDNSLEGVVIGVLYSKN